MFKKNFTASLALAIMLMAGAMVAQAATINIPGNQPTFMAAYAAAVDGDAIVFTDSATYPTDKILIAKRITVKAADGAAPTLVASANVAEDDVMITLNAGSSGGQFGSNTGGRITIDLANKAVAFVSSDSSDPGNSYTIENLEFKNIIGNSLNTGVFMIAVGMDGTLTLRNVIAKATSSVTNTSLLDMGAIGNGTINIEACDLFNAGPGFSNAGGIIWYGSGTGLLKMKNSRLIADQIVLYFEGTGHLSAEVDNCWLENKGSSGLDSLAAFAFQSGLTGGHLTFTNSALVANTYGPVVGFYAFASSDTTATFDHCDIIQTLGSIGYFQFYMYADSPAIVTVKNTNFIFDPMQYLGGLFRGSASTPGTITSDYNNVVVDGAGFYTNVTKGAHDLNGVANKPVYTDFAGLDLSYSAPANVKTGGEGGSAIGSNRSFKKVGPPQPPTAARSWSLFE